MKKTFYRLFVNLYVWVLPALAYAQGSSGQGTTFKTLVDRATQFIINPLLGLLVAVALVAFLWGLVRYIQAQAGGDSGARNEAVQLMIWGVVGLTVMLVVWQLVGILARTFGLNATSVPSVGPTSGALIEGAWRG